MDGNDLADFSFTGLAFPALETVAAETAEGTRVEVGTLMEGIDRMAPKLGSFSSAEERKQDLHRVKQNQNPFMKANVCCVLVLQFNKCLSCLLAQQFFVQNIRIKEESALLDQTRV